MCHPRTRPTHHAPRPAPGSARVSSSHFGVHFPARAGRRAAPTPDRGTTGTNLPANNAGFKLIAANGDEFEITGPFRIGRDDDCQIKVDNTLASRIHASIWVDHGQLLLRDERSRNGTFVNGRRLPPGESHRLYDADRVQIVGATYIVVTPPPPFEPPKPLRPRPPLPRRTRRASRPPPGLCCTGPAAAPS